MANASHNQVPLGPWADADLKHTAQMGVGVGADDGLSLELRFVRNVAELLRRRNSQAAPNSDPKSLAVFLLKPDPSDLNLPGQARRVPMLNNGLTRLTGRLWFVGGGPASGQFCEGLPPDDNELFSFVVDELKGGDCAAIIHDPRPQQPETRYYPVGLQDPNQYRTLSLTTEEVDVDKVLAVIDAVYRTNLITPESQSQNKLWENAAKWWPCEDAESKIQSCLKAGLAGHFLACTIRDEQSMPEGRLDIEIEESDPSNRSQVTRHAILELKVLRSFGKSGSIYSAVTTQEWVKSGVEQAATYRQGKGAKWSALFCFDMRKDVSGQACFDHIKDLASSLNVLVRCWHIYASAKLYRAVALSGT